MKQFSATITLFLGSMLLSGMTALGSKPNIVMIYVDDWAWGGSSVRMQDDMSNSATELLSLPHIEKMAASGMKFSRAYGSHQCAPARAAVQTGQSNPRNGFTLVLGKTKGDYYDLRFEKRGFPMIPNISDPSLDADAITIPEALKPYGYVSAHLGKWHLYSDPGAEGYILHSGDTTNNEGNTIGKGNDLSKDLTDPKLMFSLTEQAIGFMAEQVAARNPFYVQISHYAVHNGSECLYSTLEEFDAHPMITSHYEEKGKIPKMARGRPSAYFGMTKDLDTTIGLLLEKIESLGIEDNTYVILVSDNGYRRKDLMVDPNFSQPLHAHKWWAWEAGIRVPMIVMGPGIKGGSVFQGNVVNYDFLPTFVEWAGGDPASLENIDGVSLAPYMAGAAPTADFLNRPIYFHVPHYRGQTPHSAVISGDYKLMHFYQTPEIPMLFDLKKDPGERNNIATFMPEKHSQLLDQMNAYFKHVDAKIPKTNPNYDPDVFAQAPDYQMFQQWSAFEGTRPLGGDEK